VVSYSACQRTEVPNASKEAVMLAGVPKLSETPVQTNQILYRLETKKKEKEVSFSVCDKKGLYAKLRN
jgi:hypothetical protein